MPTPTFDQLVQFREDYVESWNSGDKERFAANWRQFVPSGGPLGEQTSEYLPDGGPASG